MFGDYLDPWYTSTTSAIPHVYTNTTIGDKSLGTTLTGTSWTADIKEAVKRWSPYGNPEDTSNPYAQCVLGKEELPDMSVFDQDCNMGIYCRDPEDLSEEHVLRSISIMKGKLEIDCAAIRVKYVECIMTAAVRQNIVKASKRLAMYGKKRPLVARFDEYGNQLPDEIKIDTSRGMTVRIIEPDQYGEFYLALKAVRESNRT